MELESSYQLLGVIRDDGIRTFRAIEIATGQALQVHLFARPDSEPDLVLFKALRGLPVSRRKELLDIGTEGDQPYIVTEALPDSVAARDWLIRLAGLPPGASVGPVTLAGSWKTGTPIPDEVLKLSHASPPPKLPAPPRQPAEMTPDFTRVMRLDTLGAFQSGFPNPASPLSVPPPNEEPDELDRMFASAPPPGAPLGGLPGAPPPLPPPQPSGQDDFDWILRGTAQPVSAPPAAKPPGDFTKLFSVPAGAPPSPPPAIQPGNFTGTFFATSTVETVRPAAPAPVPSASLPSPVASKPTGEFTAAFFTAPPPETPPPVIPQQSPAPPPQATPPGDLTKVFFADRPPEPAPPVIPQQPAAPPPQDNRPGNLTQVFIASQPPEPPVVRQPPAASLPSGDPPGDFTKVFFTGQPAQPVPPVVPPQATAAPPVSGRGPGEFTLMFQAPAQPTENPPGEFTSRFMAGQPPQIPVAQETSAPAGAFTKGFPKPQPVRTDAPPPAAAPADEATRLFQPGPLQPPNAPPPPPPLQSHQPLPAQAPPVPPSFEEATRLFQPAAPPATPSEPLAFPPPPREPGEFTRSFGSPVSPRSDALAAPPVSTPSLANPDGPSEFTRFFESPMAPQTGGRQAVNPNLPASMQAQPVVQTPRPGHQPGEFTQMFGPRSPASSTPPAPLGPAGPGGTATGSFAFPQASTLAPPGSSASSGDYTQMMSSASPATPTLGQSHSGAPPAASAKSKLPLYIIGGAVLLAIILILVFFLFR